MVPWSASSCDLGRVTSEAEDGAVLRMHQTPQFEQLTDGSWRASYAGTGWSVVAATKDVAVADLQAEDRRRVESDPAYREFLFQLARRTLDDPVPNIESGVITRGEYWYRTGGRERTTVEGDTRNGS